MPIDPLSETANEINDLRNRALAGEDIPPEEYRRIIDALRAGRLAAVSRAGKKKSTSAPAEILTGALPDFD